METQLSQPDQPSQLSQQTTTSPSTEPMDVDTRADRATVTRRFIELFRWVFTICFMISMIVSAAMTKSGDDFALVAGITCFYSLVLFFGFEFIVMYLMVIGPMYILFWGTKWYYGLAAWPLMDTIYVNLNLSAALF